MEEAHTHLTKIEELGEFGLIDRLQRLIEIKLPSTVVSGGDDAAVVSYEGQTVISTDMFVEGVHFDMMYTPLQHLGYKCISGAVSDIYAMNAMAKHVVVSLGISAKYTVEAIEEIYKGMRFACTHYGVDLVGGDTTSSPAGLIISVTTLGTAWQEDIVTRSGARPKELICVTGDLGGAYAGLQVLEREKRVFKEAPGAQPNLDGFEYVIKRQLRPEARKDIVELLRDLDVLPTAMIDISDGLASEVMHLCKQSNTGCRVFEDKIPLDDNTSSTALKFGIDPTLCALSGGEDYELLFTVRQEDHDKVKNVPDFTVIGYMTEADEGCKLMTKAGAMYELKAQGWKHF